MNATIILTIFVACTAVAVTVQMGILFALYKTVDRSSRQLASLAKKLEDRALPLLDSTHAILADAQPKISEIAANLAETSTLVRYRIEHVSEATSEIIERARVQAARIDDMITATTDKVEQTTEFLQNSIFAPVRRIQAIIQALVAGMSFFRRGRAMAKARAAAGEEEDEEMFI